MGTLPTHTHSCCLCCVAADERDELPVAHGPIGADCPLPPCDVHQSDAYERKTPALTNVTRRPIAFAGLTFADYRECVELCWMIAWRDLDVALHYAARAGITADDALAYITGKGDSYAEK